VLVCDLTGFRRVAPLEELPLPGGELAVRRPARTAVGWLAALLGPGEARSAASARGLVDPDELEAVLRQVDTGTNAPRTSSCGRLFDAVAALAGVRTAITYEGQAAIELEMVSSTGAAPYPYEVDERKAQSGDAWGALAADGGEGAVSVIRLAPLFAALLDDLRAGREPPAPLAGSRLHATIPVMILDVCRRVRRDEGLRTVVLSGGVFQNRLLTDLCETALAGDGFEVLTHALVPANDGGLSLGQAAVAGYTLLRDPAVVGR
jgi:hydrogenase maturation protein HypF